MTAKRKIPKLTAEEIAESAERVQRTEEWIRAEKARIAAERAAPLRRRRRRLVPLRWVGWS
jgi:hypothetical protein